MAAVTVPRAQTFESPALKPGDTWTYRNTTEKGKDWNQSNADITIDRLTSSAIYYSQKQSGSTQPPQQAVAGTD